MSDTGLPGAAGRDLHAVFQDANGGVYVVGGDLFALTDGTLRSLGTRTLAQEILPRARLRDRVQPLLYTTCATTACHLPPFLNEELDLSTADAILGSAVGRPSNQAQLLRVVPGRPSQSYLWHKLIGTHLDVGGTGERMPNGEDPMPRADLDAIRAWILEGARDN